MTKSELIELIAARNPHLVHNDVTRVVNTVFDEIIDSLAQGNRVELRGFGAFSVKQRKERIGRNPKNGEAVKVESKVIPSFKTGKKLREMINNGSTK